MASRHKASKSPTWQKATAVLPLALLAGAWTASLGSSTIATAGSGQTEPGVPAVPTTTFNQPASYTVPPELDPDDLASNPNQSTGPGAQGPSSTSSNGIPTAAMAAYQRAETILNKADPGCRISWELIAAIGRVESDHGRYGGNVLGSNGKSTPGIYGIPLDGSNGTALIKDTDSGAYDNDNLYDRAVGPMQFIPGTWEMVGVDADGDGSRDPQDIDDAAVSAGVYLCAGGEDLSTTSGQRSAVFSYNHSDEYVDLVLDIMETYADGDYTTVADGLPSNNFVPDTDTQSTQDKPGNTRGRSQPRVDNQPVGREDDSDSPDGDGSPEPRDKQPRGDGPRDQQPQDNQPKGDEPAPDPPEEEEPPPDNEPDTVRDTEKTVKDTVTDAERRLAAATSYCQSQLTGSGASGDQVQKCINAYVSGGQGAADNVIGNVLDALSQGLDKPLGG